MPKKNDVIEQELKDRFDKALDELVNLDEKDIDILCSSLNIQTEKVDTLPLYPEEKFFKYEEGMTPAQMKVGINKYFSSIPKGYTYGGGYHGGWVKKTPLFNHKNHKVNKIKQTINLKLLLESAGSSKGYLNRLACYINMVEGLKSGADYNDLRAIQRGY